jgi:hypothetical protein
MQVTRKIAAAAAVATVATLGLATVVSANMVDNSKAGSGLADAASKVSKDGYGDHGKKLSKWYAVEKDGGLIAIDENKIGPFQACDNFVPVNVLGVQVPVNDIVGIVGLDQEGNRATAVETCEQEVGQNSNHGKWYRAEESGLISVSENKVGPFQVCHNYVPVNVLGVQVPVNDLTGLLGLDQEDNGVDKLETCEQEVGQNS